MTSLSTADSTPDAFLPQTILMSSHGPPQLLEFMRNALGYMQASGDPAQKVDRDIALPVIFDVGSEFTQIRSWAMRILSACRNWKSEQELSLCGERKSLKDTRTDDAHLLVEYLQLKDKMFAAKRAADDLRNSEPAIAELEQQKSDLSQRCEELEGQLETLYQVCSESRKNPSSNMLGDMVGATPHPAMHLVTLRERVDPSAARALAASAWHISARDLKKLQGDIIRLESTLHKVLAAKREESTTQIAFTKLDAALTNMRATNQKAVANLSWKVQYRSAQLSLMETVTHNIELMVQPVTHAGVAHRRRALAESPHADSVLGKLQPTNPMFKVKRVRRDSW